MASDIPQYESTSLLLKSLAHPLRLQIVHGLILGGCHNVRCMEEGTGQSQSTISQHLAKLRAAGVVSCQRSGNEMLYQVTNPLVCELIEALFDTGPDCGCGQQAQATSSPGE